MRKLAKGLLVWILAYLAVLGGFIILASAMAPSNQDPSIYGSSDLLGLMTLLAKLAAASIPAALLGKASGKAGVLLAVALMVGVIVLAQALPGGLVVFSIFSGEPPAMAALYVAISGLCAAATAWRSVGMS